PTSVAATVVSTPSITQGVSSMGVKVGLTPADLKLPPPRKVNNSPPNSSFSASPRSEAGTPSTPNIGLSRPAGGANNLNAAPKQSKAALSTSTVPPSEQQQINIIANPEVASPTGTKAVDAPSSQILLKTRQIQLQQAQIQQQQQQQLQQQQLVPQQQQQQQPAQPVSQQLVPQLAAQTIVSQPQTSPLPSTVNITGRQGSIPLETLSKEDLIRWYQNLKASLSAPSGPPPSAKQTVLVRMQLQQIQAELAKPYRQEQLPRLGEGLISTIEPAGNSVSTAASLQANVPSTNQLFSISQATAPTDLGPQIRELQMQDIKVGPSQPMDPLDFLTFSYKSLTRVEDEGIGQVIPIESSLVLRNSIEGFVGKRIGNGPGKDMYDYESQKRRKVELKDDDLVNAMHLTSDGQPDAFMASYGDWAQQIPAR
ncbi:hypothetical protein FBU30_002565, partial [Linnemannia zychae]